MNPPNFACKQNLAGIFHSDYNHQWLLEKRTSRLAALLIVMSFWPWGFRLNGLKMIFGKLINALINVALRI